MSRARNIPMPTAKREYTQTEEQIFRRTVETGIQQVDFSIESTKRIEDSVHSLALKRFQFLLMGAKCGG